MKKKLICLLMVAVLVVSALGVLAACQKVEQDVELPIEKKQDETHNADYAFADSNVVRAMSLRKVASRAVNGGISITVTATVYPSNVENKLVDWKLVWAEDETSVTSCVTLDIPTDGSLTVTLTCTEAFPNKPMKLICTSRASGASAFIEVRCDGIPSEMTVDGGTTIDVHWNNTSQYDIELDNLINYIGDSYYDVLTVKSVTINGTIDYYNWLWKANSTSAFDGTYTVAGNHTQYQLKDLYSDAVTASISNRKLTLSVIAYPSTTYSSSLFNTACPNSTMGGVGAKWTDVYFLPEDVSADIVIGTGNLTETIHVNFIIDVSSITLDRTEIAF